MSLLVEESVGTQGHPLYAFFLCTHFWVYAFFIFPYFSITCHASCFELPSIIVLAHTPVPIIRRYYPNSSLQDLGPLYPMQCDPFFYPLPRVPYCLDSRPIHKKLGS